MRCCACVLLLTQLAAKKGHNDLLCVVVVCVCVVIILSFSEIYRTCLACVLCLLFVCVVMLVLFTRFMRCVWS